MSVRAAICPHFDSCDPRCGARMTLGHLDEVFRFCTAEYESCPVFRGSASGVAGGTLAREEHECTASIGAAQVSDGCFQVSDGRFQFCDGPVADDLAREITGEVAAIANLAHACIGRVVELTIERSNERSIERAPLGRPAVA